MAVVNHSVTWAMLSQYSRAEEAPVAVNQYKVIRVEHLIGGEDLAQIAQGGRSRPIVSR